MPTKYKPGDIIKKINDDPFPTQKIAAQQQGLWEKRGVDADVIEIEGGWALEVVGKESPERRPKRVPLGYKNVLTAPKEQGYVRRWVNDTEGRVAMFEEAGWEVVVDPKMKGGDEYAGNTRLPGSAVTKPVGSGVTGVLMQKRRDWFEEDYAEKQKIPDRTEEGLIRQAQVDNLHIDTKRNIRGIEIDRPNR